MSTEGRLGPTKDEFNPTKKHKPTMLMNEILVDDIKPERRAAAIIEEAGSSTCLALLSLFLSFLMILPTLFV
jgi:hypothetical protein